MRLLLILLLISVRVVAGNEGEAKGIQFFHGTLADALKKADLEGKLVFMDAYTSWCGPCKRMAAQTFTDESIGKYFNEHFINVKFDMEQGEGTAIATKYGIYSYPTLLFLDGSGKQVGREMGFKDAPSLIAIGNKYYNAQFDTKRYDEQYESKEYDQAFLLKYIDVLRKARKPYNFLVDEYIQKNTAWETREQIDFLYNNAVNADSKVFQLFIENKNKIIEYQGETNFNNKLMKACTQLAWDAGKSKSNTMLQAAENLVKLNATDLLPEFKMLSNAHFALGSGDTKKFSSSILKYAKKYQWNNKTELDNIAKLFSFEKNKESEKIFTEINNRINQL